MCSSFKRSLISYSEAGQTTRYVSRVNYNKSFEFYLTILCQYLIDFHRVCYNGGDQRAAYPGSRLASPY